MGLLKKMRAAIGANRAILVGQQVELRLRARQKFHNSESMFFTKLGLEQSTDEQIAGYKTQQIPESYRVADLCCGIGGDLIQLSEQHSTTGFDLDPLICHLAEHNCRVNDVIADIQQADVMNIDAELSGFDFVHVDPDRRVSNERHTQVESYQPPLSFLESLREQGVALCIKLAPGSEVPHHWLADCKTEWIESRRECRQQVLWLDESVEPGSRCATEVSNNGVKWQVYGSRGEPTSWSYEVRRFIYEPRPSVLAAGIADSVAQQMQLEAIWPDVVYWTSDSLHDAPWAGVFEVEEVLPFDVRKLREYFAARGVGSLEIKKRLTDVKPEQLRKELRLNGDESRVLLLAGCNQKTIAIIAQRVEPRLP